MEISIFEWMEDFDNAELSGYDRNEQLRDAVIEYNEKHKTDYNPDNKVEAYFGWHFQKRHESN